MRMLLSGLLVAVCIMAGAARPAARLSSAPVCSCIVTSSAAAPDTRGKDSAPLTVKIVTAPAQESGGPSWAERDTAYATIGLAVITMLLAVATAVLARFTWKLWKSTKALVEEGNETAKRELRAYVAVEGYSISNIEPEQQPRVRINIRNFGRTPAYKFKVSVSAQFHSENDPKLEPAEPERVLGHLAPDAPFGMHAKCGLTLQLNNWNQIVADTAAVYVFGIIRYVDTFNQPHYTRFRVKTVGADSVEGGALGSRAELETKPTMMNSWSHQSRRCHEIGELAVVARDRGALLVVRIAATSAGTLIGPPGARPGG